MPVTATAAPKSKAGTPERVPMVILFAETRGFTRTSAILQPEVVLERVSEFFAVVRAAVEREGGIEALIPVLDREAGAFASQAAPYRLYR